MTVSRTKNNKQWVEGSEIILSYYSVYYYVISCQVLEKFINFFSFAVLQIRAIFLASWEDK